MNVELEEKRTDSSRCRRVCRQGKKDVAATVYKVEKDFGRKSRTITFVLCQCGSSENTERLTLGLRRCEKKVVIRSLAELE